jgi:hypothetical protein
MSYANELCAIFAKFFISYVYFISLQDYDVGIIQVVKW